jgi:hypothetical protein
VSGRPAACGRPWWLLQDGRNPDQHFTRYETAGLTALFPEHWMPDSAALGSADHCAKRLVDQFDAGAKGRIGCPSRGPRQRERKPGEHDRGKAPRRVGELFEHDLDAGPRHGVASMTPGARRE